MNDKLISTINRAGIVIITTLTSFAISPPVIDGSDQEAVNWKNFFAFFAGVLSIILYDKYKKAGRKTKRLALWFLASLIILFAFYEIIYNEYSVNCFDKVRVVISHAPVKSSLTASYQFWEKTSHTPIKSLLEGLRCSSVEIWNMSDLIPAYYGMIILYFLMIIVLTLLLVLVSDILQLPKNAAP